MDKAPPTTVTIFGVDYRLRSQEGPEFVRAVAELAEQRMREVANVQQTASQTRIAVMALLNVVGELLREREARRTSDDRCTGRLREMVVQVEEMLSTGS
jgi:cell division protein ZapA (FtsZ GTPase activity inhibitor)